MSEVGGIFSEMMSFGEATGLTKEVAKAGFDSASEAIRIQKYYYDAIRKEKR